MVLLQCKRNEKNSFVVDLPPSTYIHKVIAKLLQLNNIRIFLERLTKAVEQLANKGVLKPQELQGISYDQLEKHAKEIGTLPEDKQKYIKRPKAEAPYRYVADKANARYGILLPADQTEVLLEAIRKAKALIQPKNETISKQQYQSAIDEIRLAVMLTYPGYYGLPAWEPVVIILQGKVDAEQMSTDDFTYFQQNANLWWAGKQLDKNKLISQYTGNNSKTKLIVKLQNPGQQQPLRQPPVDKQAYRNMVQYYYKKTQQNKKFQKESVQTVYQQPDWSKTSMRQGVHLQGPVKYRPY